MTTIHATDFDFPCSVINAINAKRVGLPVCVKVGNSGFTITPENLDAFALGVLFASDEAWDAIRQRVNERF